MSGWYGSEERRRGYNDREREGRYSSCPYDVSYDYRSGWDDRDSEERRERERCEERRAEEDAERRRIEHERRRIEQERAEEQDPPCCPHGVMAGPCPWCTQEKEIAT